MTEWIKSSSCNLGRFRNFTRRVACVRTYILDESENIPINDERQGGVEIVTVTPEMERAGLERARELVGEDPRYIVASVYLAMEYERLDMDGQLSGLDEQALKVRQP